MTSVRCPPSTAFNTSVAGMWCYTTVCEWVISQMLERSIAIWLKLKGFLVTETFQDLQETLDPHTRQDLTVNWFHDQRAVVPQTNAIWTKLKPCLFLTPIKLCWRGPSWSLWFGQRSQPWENLRKTTDHGKFTSSLVFTGRHLFWVSHDLCARIMDHVIRHSRICSKLIGRMLT
jgi:hypothetical protein